MDTTPSSPDELIKNAKHRLQIADHFLTQTYQLVQDPKLLLNILDGILKADEEMIDALLIQERKAGNLAAYNEDSFAAKLAVLKGDVGKRIGIAQIDIHMISEMQELLHDHRTSSLEFPRKGNLVMADDNYVLSTISVEKIKTYLHRSRSLHDRIASSIVIARRE